LSFSWTVRLGTSRTELLIEEPQNPTGGGHAPLRPPAAHPGARRFAWRAPRPL